MKNQVQQPERYLNLQNNMCCKCNATQHLSGLFFKVLLPFFVLIFSTSILQAQTAQIRLMLSAPEWNHKTVCDAGKGYAPSVIPAPVLSYVAKSNTAPSFSYAWEFKAGEKAWVEVAGGKSVSAIPAYEPKILFNTRDGLETFSWRVRVTNATDGVSATSDIISLSVTSKVMVSYKVEALQTDQQKMNIQLNVSGGLPGKKFTWAAADPGNQFPKEQVNREDPTGLNAGHYRVTITDNVCPAVIQDIQATINDNNKRPNLK